jgi:hypothetical protein
MKTYSVTVLSSKNNEWITNWNEYKSLNDIDWGSVRKFVDACDYLAYGYYYGEHSSGMTDDEHRTVLWERQRRG